MNRLPASSPDVDQAAAVLRAGGLVAFPTETVYALGADARNPEAVARIFVVKGRPADHPLIVHLADAGQLTGWARDVSVAAWQLADVPDAVTGVLDTVALRLPGHPAAPASNTPVRCPGSEPSHYSSRARLQVLVTVMPPGVGLGHALRDRLRRAAGLGDDGDRSHTQPQQIPGDDL